MVQFGASKKKAHSPGIFCPTVAGLDLNLRPSFMGALVNRPLSVTEYH